MRNFTKLFCIVALLFAGFTGASAQEDEVLDFEGSFYHSWSEVSATATDNGAVTGDNIGFKLGEEVNEGGIACVYTLKD